MTQQDRSSGYIYGIGSGGFREGSRKNDYNVLYA